MLSRPTGNYMALARAAICERKFFISPSIKNSTPVYRQKHKIQAVMQSVRMAFDKPMASANMPVIAGAKAAPVFSMKYSVAWAVLLTS